MATIRQGPVSTESVGQTNPAVLEAAETEDVKVQQGFSQQNSYSRVEGKKDVDGPQILAPVLEEPEPEAEAKGGAEILKQAAEAKKQEGLLKGEEGSPLQSMAKTTLAKQTAALQGKSAALESMGFSKSQIDAMLALADPDDPNNSLSSMHSASARLNDVDLKTGQAKLGKLFNTFEDVMVRFSAITEVPKDLKVELTNSFDAFAKEVSRADGMLDIDSATTQLVKIQSQLQNERLKFDQETIKLGQVSREQKSSEMISKIKESIEKVNEAKKASFFGKIFGYIGLALMAIATVAVAAISIFTGGASMVAVGFMVAGMMLMATMVASSETDNFMLKAFDELASGGGEEAKQKARTGAMAFWSALMILLSIGGAVAGGAASAGGNAANAASTSTSTATTAASTGSTAASTAATVTASGASTAATATATSAKIVAAGTRMAQMAQITGGASNMASGGAEIGAAVYNYQADTLKAESLEDKADMARIQQTIDDSMEGLEKAIDELQNGYSVATSIIKANHDTKTTLARNLRA